MDFAKWHALGNAYLLVERGAAEALTDARVRRLCDVDTGIGSDGVLEVIRREGPFAEILITQQISGAYARKVRRWQRPCLSMTVYCIRLWTANAYHGMQRSTALPSASHRQLSSMGPTASHFMCRGRS